jgi:hypothetical protein
MTELNIKVSEGKYVKQITVAILTSLFIFGAARAEDCKAKAVGSDGKPLAGAALTSFLKKCRHDACEAKAVSKEGKPLSGAAKSSFMKKCAAEAG